MKNIEVTVDDITGLKVDCIVNAANSALLGGGGVDGAIHRAAGSDLLTECRLLGGCKTGQAKITKGYNLQAQYIIHTVGPVWNGGSNNEEDLLAECYRNSLNLAAAEGIQTIAFPCISCGVYRFPFEKAVEIVTNTVNEFMKGQSSIQQVLFCCFSEEQAGVYNSLLSNAEIAEAKVLTVEDRIEGAIHGLIVGDALGVPVEFMSRSELIKKPVKSMRGFGTHNQPAGTWSDDSSLMLCNLMSILDHEINNEDVLTKFANWRYENWMTPHGRVFDIGNTTDLAIQKFTLGNDAEKCGLSGDFNNGNGSLMRILPMSIYVHRLSVAEIITESFKNSSLTHGHLRSKLCCAYFSLLMKGLLSDMTLENAMKYTAGELQPFLENETALERILSGKILNEDRDKISGSGYVVHCLEASLYCVANTENYSDAVLNAVNLGDDTDTTAAVTGAIAGALYGFNAIPQKWIRKIARIDEIIKWTDQFTEKILNESVSRHE
jgi:ADP-ribosylglycohydrolase/O-acetyl-ADP-ribose deacetylase (regulator of RNase III)